MKTFILPIGLALLLFTACVNSEKKDSEAASEESKKEAVKTANDDIDLKQEGDYTQLYLRGDQCKLTTAQLAEALGYEESKIKEQSNYEGNCKYNVTHPSGITVMYSIGMEEWKQTEVRDQLEQALKKKAKNDEMTDIRISESGDSYIIRHPFQGNLLILNPNYANTVFIQYNYFNPDGPEPTESQKEERKQNTYKIANYLINTYQN